MRPGRAIAAGAGLIVALAWIGQLEARSSFSRQADGTMALYLLLEDLGYRPERLLELSRLSDAHDVVFAIGLDQPRGAERVVRWAEQGKVVILAPPLLSDGYCGDQRFGSVSIRRELARHTTLDPPAKDLAVRDAACQLRLPKGERALVAGKDKSLALGYEQPLGKGWLLVLAHDQLLANRYVNRDDLVVLLRRWLKRRTPAAARVAFVEAKQSGRLLEMLARANLIPTVLHGLAFLLLLYWVLAPRFGESRRALEPTRRAFVQHVRALGNLYLGGNASRFALRQQYDRFLRAVGRGDRAGRGATRDERGRRTLAALLATRAGRDVQQVEQLLEEIEQAIDGAGGSDAGQMHRHFRLSRALAELHHIHHRSGPAGRAGGARGRATIR